MLRYKVFAEGVAEQIKEYLSSDYSDVELSLIHI